ncbi:MAG: division/cell wall cluster transcriptional repressor MraZ [Planctomycetia bacterium]|nr:division/cell wall cluster transcriptional repressor MraZ [Planctomycetia bacterium]
MSAAKQLILGEFSRRLDDRFRFSLPGEMLDVFQPKDGDCVIAKERPGCVSLWDQTAWKEKLDAQIDVIQSKLRAGNLEQKVPQLQLLGRLLSTRHRPVQMAAKGRIVLPEGFREFLKVEPGSELMIIGAAVCIEIWNPEKWISYIEGKMPRFRKLLTKLSN